MEIQRHTKNRKIIVPIIILVLLILSGIYLIGFKGNLFGWQPFAKDYAYNQPSKEQINTGSAIKDASDKNSKSGENPNDVGADHPDKPVVSPGDYKATASLTITAVNQNDGMLQIRALIGTLTNEGTCTLTLSKDGKTVTRTAGVQATTNSTTCKGFDIPVSDLSAGQWQATISFENSTVKASVSQEVKVL